MNDYRDLPERLLTKFERDVKELKWECCRWKAMALVSIVSTLCTLVALVCVLIGGAK